MTTGSQNRKGPQSAGATETLEKKRYRKPAFRSEQVFETMALSCGKVNVTQGSCHFNRKRS
jgi:hypothetical protein